jgi:signal transduction histidine kinase
MNKNARDEQRLKDMRNAVEQITAPVKSLVGHVEELIKGRVPEHKMQGKLTYIKKLLLMSLKYAANFERILEFDAHQVSLKKERLFDLRDYLIGFAREYRPLIKSKLIHINVTKQTKNDINIYVDKDLFYHALSNIIDNAVKYSFAPEERDHLGFQGKPSSPDDKENVLITALEEGNSVVITISSFGLEILDHEKDKIFDKGFRGVKAEERYRVGAGSGLYVAKEIIKLHDGELELVPHHHQYITVFKITLPKGEPDK